MTDEEQKKRPDVPQNGRSLTQRMQERDFLEAHAEGMHEDMPREGCPECERQGGRA